MPHDHHHPTPQHGHGHHHGHSHGPAPHDRAFAISVGLNTALVAAQIAAGFAAGSTALLADAVHNFGDVAGLLLAWGASWLGRQAPSARRTYGWGRTSILASLLNAMLLLVSIGAIGIEAVQRLASRAPVDTRLVAWVAAAGLLINGATALLFMRGRADDLNVRGAFVHMASDAALSLGVLIAALAVGYTGYVWLDPAMSLVIVGVIAAGTWGLLRQSVNLALDAVPDGMSELDVATFLGGLPGVAEVHDLHIWALSTTQTAVTAHLVQVSEDHGETIVIAAVEGLRHRFGVGHCTIQIETPAGAAQCGLRATEVV